MSRIVYLLCASLDVIYSIEFNWTTINPHSQSIPTIVKDMEAALAAGDFLKTTNAHEINMDFSNGKYFRKIEWILFKKTATSALKKMDQFAERFSKVPKEVQMNTHK